MIEEWTNVSYRQSSTAIIITNEAGNKRIIMPYHRVGNGRAYTYASITGASPHSERLEDGRWIQAGKLPLDVFTSWCARCDREVELSTPPDEAADEH